MSKEIDWSKAPEGATHYLPSSGDWFKKESGKWFYWFEGARSWTETAYADPSNFSWWGCRIERPSVTPWNGTGLPPVGTVCEALHIGSKQGKVKVLYSGEFMVLWNIEGQHEQVGRCGDYEFRPIRTPEQIAAEERQLAVDEMLSLFGGTDSRDTYLMQRLYDAGYRKTEAGK